jgi:hypothetical protein
VARLSPSILDLRSAKVVMLMLGFLRSIGLTPDMFYAASIGSMFLSLLLWFVPRNGRKDSGRPERLAVFVGLWPPTLFLMGHALGEDKKPV